MAKDVLDVFIPLLCPNPRRRKKLNSKVDGLKPEQREVINFMLTSEQLLSEFFSLRDNRQTINDFVKRVEFLFKQEKIASDAPTSKAN